MIMRRRKITRPAAVGPLWKKPRSDRGQANLSRRHPVDSLPGRRFSRRVDRGVARCLEDQGDGARRNEAIARGRCADVGIEKSACRLRIWFGRWGGRCAQGGRGRCADVGIPARCGGRIGPISVDDQVREWRGRRAHTPSDAMKSIDYCISYGVNCVNGRIARCENSNSFVQDAVVIVVRPRRMAVPSA
jgi:hypothetical protein